MSSSSNDSDPTPQEEGISKGKLAVIAIVGTIGCVGAYVGFKVGLNVGKGITNYLTVLSRTQSGGVQPTQAVLDASMLSKENGVIARISDRLAKPLIVAIEKAQPYMGATSKLGVASVSGSPKGMMTSNSSTNSSAHGSQSITPSSSSAPPSPNTPSSTPSTAPSPSKPIPPPSIPSYMKYKAKDGIGNPDYEIVKTNNEFTAKSGSTSVSATTQDSTSTSPSPSTTSTYNTNLDLDPFDHRPIPSPSPEDMKRGYRAAKKAFKYGTLLTFVGGTAVIVLGCTASGIWSVKDFNAKMRTSIRAMLDRAEPAIEGVRSLGGSAKKMVEGANLRERLHFIKETTDEVRKYVDSNLEGEAGGAEGGNSGTEGKEEDTGAKNQSENKSESEGRKDNNGEGREDAGKASTEEKGEKTNKQEKSEGLFARRRRKMAEAAKDYVIDESKLEEDLLKGLQAIADTKLVIGITGIKGMVVGDEIILKGKNDGVNGGETNQKRDDIIEGKTKNGDEKEDSNSMGNSNSGEIQKESG